MATMYGMLLNLVEGCNRPMIREWIRCPAVRFTEQHAEISSEYLMPFLGAQQM
jgi:hypothetical protein